MKESTQRSLDILSNGINAELSAYVFYKRASEKTENKNIVEMFNKLASEEKDHYKLLETQYDSLVRSEKWVTYNDIIRKEGLPEIPEEMAKSHRNRIIELETAYSLNQILNLALELEQEAYDFYSGQIDKVDDPIAKEMLTYLSKFELGHINLIKNWKQKL